MLALCWAAILLGALGAERASARTFRAADSQSEEYPTVQALRFFGSLVQERTGGRHRIQVFHSHQLGEEVDTLEQTRAGAIDINRVNIAPLGSFAPTANVFVLPYLFRSAEHLRTVIDGPIGQEILDSFGPSGFIGLAFYDSGARSMYSSRRPIRALADLKGLRIRVQQSELAAAMVRALGAVPVPMPYSHVATGLQANLVDAAENNWPSYVSAGHHRLAPFYALTEHTRGPEVLVISRQAWASLSAEDQAVFRSAAQESSRFMREQWQALEERTRQQGQADGVVAAEIDRAPFEAATAPLLAEAAADPTIRDLVDRIRRIE